MRAFIATGIVLLFLGENASAADVVLGDFEGRDYGTWTVEGEAFGKKPLLQISANPRKYAGFKGQGLAGGGQFSMTGTLTSQEFTVERKFINFLIYGERHWPKTVGVELLVDGKVLRSSSATEAADPTRTLHPRTFDVSEFIGKKARLRVNDQSTTGAIAVDQFVASDNEAAVPCDATTLLHESHRPQFHFTAQAGWLNDANGMFFYDGLWHLCHQHLPPGAEAKVWGHAVSNDLLHWKHRPTAIANEGDVGIYSGSGWVDVNNASGTKRGEHPPILMFYSLAPPSNSGIKMTQALAVSHDGGNTFDKFEGNPILRTEATRDRDPKTFYHEPSQAWFMILSLSRNNTDRDHATYGLYRSRDVKQWELIQEIGPGSWYWECPDMFEMPIDGDANRTQWVLMKGSGDYILGSFDGQRFTPETEPIRTAWGSGYYGAQTFSVAPEGRRIQMAWMHMGKEASPDSYPGMPFNHQMSFPREFTLRTTADGPRIFSYPVREIEQLHAKTMTMPAGTLTPGKNALEGVTDELLDVDAEIDLGDAKQLFLTLHGNEMRYDVKNAKLHAFGVAYSLKAPEGKLALRILVDRASVELFGNGGEMHVSKVFVGDPRDRSLSLTVDGGNATIRRLQVHGLKSIWN